MNLVSLVLGYESYRPVYHVDDDDVFKFRTSLRIEFTEIQPRLGRNLKSNLLVKTDVMQTLIRHLLNIISKILKYK